MLPLCIARAMLGMKILSKMSLVVDLLIGILVLLYLWIRPALDWTFSGGEKKQKMIRSSILNMCCVTCIRIYGSIYLPSTYQLIVYTCTLILITLSCHLCLMSIYLKLNFDVYKLLQFYMINSHLHIIYIVFK